MIRIARRHQTHPEPLRLTPPEWRAWKGALRLERERRRRGWVLAAVATLTLAVVVTAAPAAPPDWWPWPTWLPGTGYLPITRSPRVLAGSVN